MSNFKTYKHHACLCVVLLIFLTHTTFAVDFSFRLTPEAVLPLSQKKSIAVDQVYGGIINADLNLFNCFTAGPEISVHFYKSDYSKDLSSVFGTGFSAGAFYAPFSRIMLSASGSFGMYFSNYEFGKSGADSSIAGSNKTSYILNNIYYRAFADLFFRINPNFTMGLGAGYTNFVFDSKQALFEGLQAGITSKITIETKKYHNKIEVDLLQEENIYPLFASLYSLKFEFSKSTAI